MLIILNNFNEIKSTSNACIYKSNDNLYDYLPCINVIYIIFTKTTVQ